MQPLFPGFEKPVERPIARWARLTATLTPEGRVVSVTVEAITPEGSVVLSNGFWPPPGHRGTTEPLRDLLSFGKRLVLDYPLPEAPPE